MDLQTLRSFVLAAELGSLSRASAARGVAQSALSRQLAALEAEVGGRLFHRTGRGVTLTETGLGMLPRAQALLADAQAMVEEAHQVMQTPRGTVAIGLVPAWSHALVGRLVAWQREHFPGIRLQVQEGYSGEVEEWLAEGRIDVGVFNRYRPVRRGQSLVTSPMHLVARADARGVGPALKLRALAALPLALPTRPNALRMVLDELAQRAGVKLDVSLEANSSAAIKSAVLHGGLCSVLPLHGVAQECRLGLLRAVPIVEPTIRQSTLLDTTTHRPLAAAAREVWRALPALLAAVAAAPDAEVPTVAARAAAGPAAGRARRH